MTRNAMDIAKHIISFCASKGKPISNLKLQKLLYFTWIEYYKQTKAPLFNDAFYAWQFGPVVPDVYYEFCMYAGTPIRKIVWPLIGTEDKEIINNIIEKYNSFTAGELVEKSHRVGGAWDVTYKNGFGNRSQIPFSTIRKLEMTEI